MENPSRHGEGIRAISCSQEPPRGLGQRCGARLALASRLHLSILSGIPGRAGVRKKNPNSPWQADHIYPPSQILERASGHKVEAQLTMASGSYDPPSQEFLRGLGRCSGSNSPWRADHVDLPSLEFPRGLVNTRGNPTRHGERIIRSTLSEIPERAGDEVGGPTRHGEQIVMIYPLRNP
jgi:hypothetical protein